MNRQALIVVSALALLALAGAGAFADTAPVNQYGAGITQPCPPPELLGRGPGTCVPAQTTCTIWDTCNPDTAINICGTFCDAGQKPAGWPYGWCDQYWLRPDSNF